MYLNCHSYFSLRYGTLSIEDLVEKSFAYNVDSVVLTDINNTAGIPEFYYACKSAGVKAIAGVDIRDKKGRQSYVLIAENNKGLEEINKFLSLNNINNSDVYFDTTSSQNVFKITPIENYDGQTLSDYEFIGIRSSKPESLFKLKDYQHKNKLVVLHTVSFACYEDYVLHCHLRAVSSNILLSNLPPNLYSSVKDSFISPSELRRIFASYPYIISNTISLLEKCSLYFNNTSKNIQTFTGDKKRDVILLRRSALSGLKERYSKNKREAVDRLKHELSIIEKLDFVCYFLLTLDVVNYAKHKDFFHVGRGSGANSIVSYCLGITDVDPIELNLYFERFLNPKRSSPPDFDIDFSWQDRDEILKYIFKKYGKERTCLLGATGTFKLRSALREIAKVYGLPKYETDALANDPGKYKDKDFLHKKIYKYASGICGFPNLRTIHAGGILISEEPIYCYTATDMPPKAMPTSQWDMYTAEKIGFEKLDILSQRGLGHIRDCIKIIKKNTNIDINIREVEKFKKDEKIKTLLRNAETLGCFYIESPAMRGLIAKLRCDDYKTLVAASSIIRPGVSQSGMMKEYIKRYNNPQSFKFLHPVLEKELSETYGVMVYQEDVLKVCYHYAGMKLEDADILRRAMSGKYRSKDGFLKIKNNFFDACKKNGRPLKVSQELWRQIESFAGYSFSKAHSASYSVESYQSLFLKAYFPIEFITAVINNFGGFYNPSVYFNEAKRMGAVIKLPCINNSDFLNKCISPKTIFMGFVHIKNIEKKLIDRIIAEREANGNYHSVLNFIDRVYVGKEQLQTLIKAGAFDFTEKTVPELLWEAFTVKKNTKNYCQTQKKLFCAEEKKSYLPELKQSELQKAYNQIELLGFPVSISFFDMLKTKFRGEVYARQMINFKSKTVRMLGVFVCVKYVKLSSGKYMNFCTWLDYKGDYFDSVHFPNSLSKYPLKGFGVYLMLGKVDIDFNYPVLNVEKLAKMGILIPK